MVTAVRDRVARAGRFEWILGAIALIGLAGRWAYVLVAKRPFDACTIDGVRQTLCGDALYYKSQADVIAAGRWFEDPFRGGSPAADHPPLNALVLAPVSWLTGGNHIAMRLLLGLFGAATIVLIGLLGRRIAGDRVGWVAAAVAALNPNLWVNDGVLMSESLATLLFVIVVLCLYRLWDRPEWRSAAGLGAALGLLMLTRAELAMYLPLVIVPVMLFRRGVAIRRALALCVAVGAMAGLMLVPWTAYNASRFERPVLISTNDGLTVLGANCQNTYYGGGVGFWDLGCYFEAEKSLPADLDQSQRSAELRRIGTDFIGEHTDRVPAVVAIRVGRLWGFYQPGQIPWLSQGEGREPWVSWAAWDALWVLLPLSAMGTVLLWRRGFRPLWPLVSTFFISTFTAVIFYGIPRFRIAADVAMCVLAAVAVEEGWRRWDARRKEGPDRRAGRLPTLDGYRALAMAVVLANHAAFATGYGSRSEVGRFLGRSAVGVPLFFVLSAFLVYRPFAAAHAAGAPPPSWPSFLRNRAVRIIPAYWAALIGVTIIGGLAHTSVRGWIANAFVLPAFGAPVQACDLGTCTTGYALAPAWTIGVQLCFYAFLPIYDRVLRRVFPTADRRRLLLGAGVVYAAGFAARLVLVMADPSWARRATFTLPLWLDVFALGMVLTVLALPRPDGVDSHDAVVTEPWRARLDRSAGAVWPWWLVAATLVFVGTRVSPPADPFGLGTQGAIVRVACFGLAAAVALVPGIFGNQDAGLLRRVLASGPLRWLGMISLSFYLWHLPIMEKVKEWIVPGYPALRSAAASAGADNPLGALVIFTGSFWRVALLTFGVTTIVASFAYLFIERPASRWRASTPTPEQAASTLGPT